MSGEAEATETYRRREYAVPCWIDSCTHGRPVHLCSVVCAERDAADRKLERGRGSAYVLIRTTSSELCRSCVGACAGKGNCTTVCSG